MFCQLYLTKAVKENNDMLVISQFMQLLHKCLVNRGIPYHFLVIWNKIKRNFLKGLKNSFLS